MRFLETPSPIHPDRRDMIATFDSVADLARYGSTCPFAGGGSEWYGNVTATEAMHRTVNGDESLVAASDALLEQFEAVAFQSSATVWADDVVGAVPNVPAFLAGVPCNMRRRRREDSSATAPLALVVDVSTSAVLTNAQIQRRGAAVLALARILSTRRPVELWVGSCGAALKGHAESKPGASFVFGRVETAPLNLASAAFVMMHPGFHRHLCYGIERKHFGFNGQWPYGAAALSPENMAKVVAPAFDHVAETVCIPGMHVADLATRDPAKWVAEMVAKLSPKRLEDA